MGDDPTSAAPRRRRIIRGVEDSLRRLNTDWIDLYQIHRPDPNTDIDETLGALSDLVHEGKIRYFGHSTFPASEIVEAQWTARSAGTRALPLRAAALLDPDPRRSSTTCCPPVSGTGSASSPTARWPAAGSLGATARTPKSRVRPPPLGRRNRFDMSDPANQRKLDAAEQLAQLAEQAGITLIELALAFVLRHPAITAAIIGPRTMEHLESQLTAADIELSDDVLDRIDEISRARHDDQRADNGWTQQSLNPAHRRRR